jgi:hypothetical protein
MSVSLAAAFCFGLTSPVLAQRYSGRSGFWISGEAGLSYANVECGSICYSDAFMAPTGIVSIGGSPSAKTSIALELSYWRVVADTTGRDYGVGMAVLRYFPVVSRSLFFKFGAGVGRYGEERIRADGSRWDLSATGFSIQVGAGYDFPLSSHFRIGPTVSYVAALGHKAKRNRLPTTDMTGKLLRIGAQITWR